MKKLTDLLKVRLMPLHKYFKAGEAKQAHLLQMRVWRREQRDRRFAALAAAQRAAQPQTVPPAKYVPMTTHCPGVVAFGVLYGDRRQ